MNKKLLQNATIFHKLAILGEFRYFIKKSSDAILDKKVPIYPAWTESEKLALKGVLSKLIALEYSKKHIVNHHPLPISSIEVDLITQENQAVVKVSGKYSDVFEPIIVPRQGRTIQSVIITGKQLLAKLQNMSIIYRETTPNLKYRFRQNKLFNSRDTLPEIPEVPEIPLFTNISEPDLLNIDDRSYDLEWEDEE